MSAGESAIEKFGTFSHAVQLYEADSKLLVRNVGDYIHQGLLRGEGVLLIASRGHREQFLRRLGELGADPAAAVASRQLTVLDAAEALSRFVSDGKPDWDRFEQEIGRVVIEISESWPAGCRAYGEMVGLLWSAGMYASAIRLEQFWNELLARHRFSLFCGYPIDIFSGEFQLGAIAALLCAHTHVVPAGSGDELDGSLQLAMNEVLGKRAEGVRSLMNEGERSGAAVISKGESAILWLRNHLPVEAEKILARARRYYQESQRLGTPATDGVRQ